MQKILTTLIFISSYCFGLPIARPQYEIEGVVDVYVYDQNPVTRQQGNGNLHCTGRNCGYVTNQNTHRHPHHRNPGGAGEMIIILVPDDQPSNGINPNQRIPQPNRKPWPNQPTNLPPPYPHPYPNQNLYPSIAPPTPTRSPVSGRRPNVPINNSFSPVPAVPTTTMSIDDIISNVFDTTTGKPVYDIDVRMDS